MIALYGIVVGLIVGYLRRGSFGNIARVKLRVVSVVFVALAIQLLIFPTPWWPDPPIGIATNVFHLASYGLLLVFLILNRHIKMLWGIAVGMVMNLSAITVNGGFMPTSLRALRLSGDGNVADRLVASPNGVFGNVVAMGESTRLNILGDWIPVPPWLPLGSSFSLGDLVLIVSAAWLIQGLMQPRAGG